MGLSTDNIHATLQPDGLTLRLEEKLALPPGRVSLTIQLAEPTTGPTMLEVLNRIHREQYEQARRPMTDEEIASEIADMRGDDKEYEERWQQIWSQVPERDQTEG